MNFLVILNKDGGTLRSLDTDKFGERVRDILESGGHGVELRIAAGREIIAALEDAARSDAAEVVMAGGGDGTISAAATAVLGSEKALAVLPAGTMNLFARSLGIPLALDAAVELTRTSSCEIEYWPTADPSLVTGSRETMLDAYRALRDDLLRRLRARFPPGGAPTMV